MQQICRKVGMKNNSELGLTDFNNFPDYWAIFWREKEGDTFSRFTLGTLRTLQEPYEPYNHKIHMNWTKQIFGNRTKFIDKNVELHNMYV